MSTVNASTGFSPFQVYLGRSPRLIPPFTANLSSSTHIDYASDAVRAEALLRRIQTDFQQASDSLLGAKADQAAFANHRRSPEIPYAEGDRVLLSTFHLRRDLKARDPTRVAK
ncbi:hypothetical protein OF83DRAFT_1026351, partial [Amylostereum chailletii]